MTFTVRSLLDLAAVRTISLTPAAGEAREITWTHVCELAEPWKWLGPGALVLTTGGGVPTTTDAQCEYIAGLHDAGIAALVVHAGQLQAPLTRPTLAFAAQLGFAVLETASDVPFIAVETAVANGVKQQAELRAHATERLYAALDQHPVNAPIDALLLELAQVLGGSLQLERAQAVSDFDPDPAAPPAPGRLALPLAGAVHAGAAGRHSPSLVWTGPGVAPRELLQHAAGIVGSALAVKLASHRAEWMHGSLLLADLCDATVPSAPAAHLVAAYGIEPPYVLAVAPGDDPRSLLDEVHAGFAELSVPVLATVKDGQVLLLAREGSECDRAFDALAGETTRIGVSATFSDFDGVSAALGQACSAVIRNHQSGYVLRFEEHATTSLFLPQGTDQLRNIARQVLGPLTTYDQQRGTSLTHTLQVFLEENRSWVRASERLYVHRQTLIARVSRIEKIIDRDLSSMEDAAECWLAVQAAIGCGDLTPSSAQGEAVDDTAGLVAGADTAI
ncbi:purine catabolism regulator [Leucobacter exalbidus]|uniref:Purine catabolism regulator n=1 Tax=Leucobacter exalbidus TaxID=662960 RepID=A0A940PU05_9MICO|nr:PucR family transcriptional regulator ligand-binding domain-containing protein [Leucobacter exalbidus]MBP1326195.1 purine catabolism regulator [Leucobacter exalbidus]